MQHPLRMSALATLAALTLGLTACQTTPRDNANLNAARSALAQARANPLSAQAAGAELDRAQQALLRAESAWNERHDSDETQHLAYLAQRRAAIALAMAEQAQAEEVVRQAGAERERLRLEARTREAAAAQNAASAARSEASQQAQRAAALERDLQALSARSTQRGLVVTLGDVLFASGRAQLQPGAQRQVQQLAQVMQQYGERHILVEGFTDDRGSAQSNLALSQRRAEAFRDALVRAGVPAERIQVQAHGEDQPVADNATAEGRQRNRRVEVLFSDANGKFAGR